MSTRIGHKFEQVLSLTDMEEQSAKHRESTKLVPLHLSLLSTHKAFSMLVVFKNVRRLRYPRRIHRRLQPVKHIYCRGYNAFTT